MTIRVLQEDQAPAVYVDCIRDDEFTRENCWRLTMWLALKSPLLEVFLPDACHLDWKRVSGPVKVKASTWYVILRTHREGRLLSFSRILRTGLLRYRPTWCFYDAELLRGRKEGAVVRSRHSPRKPQLTAKYALYRQEVAVARRCAMRWAV